MLDLQKSHEKGEVNVKDYNDYNDYNENIEEPS